MTDDDLGAALQALTLTECDTRHVTIVHDAEGGAIVLARRWTQDGLNLVVLHRGAKSEPEKWARLELCPAFVVALYYAALAVMESDE